MDHNLTTTTLCEKASCTEEAINSNGFYIFTYNETGDSYVGKAQKQSLKKRLIQHLIIAMSNRHLTGRFDPFLRDNPHINNWNLEIEPMERDTIAVAEEFLIEHLRPTLNVQHPQTRS